MDNIERRDFLKWLAGIAAFGLLTGCEKPPPPKTTTSRNIEYVPATNNGYAVPYTKPNPQNTMTSAATNNSVPTATFSRAMWGAQPPIMSRMQPMGQITRITVHHEGTAKGDNTMDQAAVARKLQLIQAEHIKRMKAADIGYHVIIDRAGRVWQGRELKYQGAHAVSNNPNNVGVMLMGNFDIQQPTAQQMASLERTLRSLMRTYNIHSSQIYGHCDLCKTACPGQSMRTQLEPLKRRLVVV